MTTDEQHMAWVGAIATVVAAALPLVWAAVYQRATHVSGTVKDHNDRPIAGVRIYDGRQPDRFVETYQNGEFSLTIPGEIFGPSHTDVVAVADAMVPYTKRIRLGEDKELSYRLLPRYVPPYAGIILKSQDDGSNAGDVSKQRNQGGGPRTSPTASSPDATDVEARRLLGVVEDDGSVLRRRVREEPLTVGLLSAALNSVPKDNIPLGTLEEAIRMLAFLGVKELSMQSQEYVSGILPTGVEVTIWTDDYGDRTKYGVRFGKPDPGRSYFGSNDTYLQVRN
jgi:hypothetical protein